MFPSDLFGVVLKLSDVVHPFIYPVLALCVVQLVRLGVDLGLPHCTLRASRCGSC